MRWIQGWLEDLGLASRRLAKSQAFAAVAILTLAVGIGANVAMFALTHATLLRPLPFGDPDRLVALNEESPRVDDLAPVSPANLLDWASSSQSFSSMAAGVEGTSNLTGAGEPREVRASYVTANFFETLGVGAAIGRVFQGAPTSDPREVVLSHGFFQRYQAGDASIVGRVLRLDDEPYTVAGILPERFELPGSHADVWIAYRLVPGDRTNFGRYLQGYGRLRDGVSIGAASTELASIAKRLGETYPEYSAGWGVRVRPLREALVGPTRPSLLLLLGFVGVLFLIVCANLASLLLGRAAGRSGEIAVRLSMGASRARLVRQLLAESFVLAFLGGSLGLLLATWGSEFLVTSAGGLTAARDVAIGGPVVAFTVGITVLAALLFGAMPALSMTSMKGTLDALRAGGRGASADMKKTRVRRALIVFEVALAMVLLASAGLLGRSFVALHDVDPGFRANRVAAMRLTLSSSRYREPEARAEFADRLLERVRAIPGVRAAGAVNLLPVVGGPSSTSFAIEGVPPADPANEPSAEIRTVAGDYFSAMGIPLLKGRVFQSSDVEGPSRAFVIDRTLAARHFGNEDPVGRRLTVEWGGPVAGTVVGVVGPVRQRSLAGPYLPTIYFWNAQNPSHNLEVVARGIGDPEALALPLMRQVRALDPEQVVAEIRPLGEAVDGKIAGKRLVLTLVGFFAGVALLLAALGLYGVISHSVVQRTREIGIRLALGATRRSVGAMVVRQGMELTGLGLLAGTIVVLALGRLLAGSLFGVPPWDPVSIVIAAGFLLAVAFLASWLPARRAVHVDPVTALRLE